MKKTNIFILTATLLCSAPVMAKIVAYDLYLAGGVSCTNTFETRYCGLARNLINDEPFAATYNTVTKIMSLSLFFVGNDSSRNVLKIPFHDNKSPNAHACFSNAGLEPMSYCEHDGPDAIGYFAKASFYPKSKGIW